MPKIITITALFVLSASIALGQHQAGIAVFDRDHPLRFAHLCSELGHGYGAYRQAYAFFEKRSPEGRYEALVLAKVHVGWIAGPPGPNGVSLPIEKKRFALPPEWYGDPFGLALQLVSVKTQQAITGPVSTSYLHSTPGHYPVDKEYRLSASGELDWVRFVEPEERDPQADKEHRHPPELHLYGKDIPGLEGDYTLNLVLENSKHQRPYDARRACAGKSLGLAANRKAAVRRAGLCPSHEPSSARGRMELAQDRLAL